MVKMVEGHRVWDHDDALPWDRRCFAFSSRSARLAMDEYEAVRGYLVTAVRLPDADYEGRKVIENWMRSAPDSKPDRSPFPCWLTAEEWYWISKALRDWSTDASKSHTYEYQVMVRAKKRGPKWKKENW